MAVYGILNEGLFGDKQRKELRGAEGIVNKYMSSLHSPFFSDVKIDKSSFSAFVNKKADSFLLAFRANIADPKIMKQMFGEFETLFNSKIGNLKSDLNKAYPNFTISLSIKRSSLSLQINCKEK